MKEMSPRALMQATWTLVESAGPSIRFGSIFPPEHVQKLSRKSKDQHRWCHHVLSGQACTLLSITWLVQVTHLSLWCRWYSTLCPVLAMPCPFPGLAACGKILTFISTTGPAATDTRSPSDPYAQVPAFTICPTVPSPQHTRKHTQNQCIWTHTDTHTHTLAWATHPDL